MTKPVTHHCLGTTTVAVAEMIFGSIQERFVPTDPSHPELTLELNAAPVAASTIVNTQQITYKRQTVVTSPEPLIHPGRMKLPESLRREVFLIEPAEDFSAFPFLMGLELKIMSLASLGIHLWPD